ncbi:MAG: Gfo/Idh/MocA family oxidoreductase [Planctomycetes bacterium]|nr:Gfo/Idh/MocA family oxidoreductase [Planctomycetota bacterium]
MSTSKVTVSWGLLGASSWAEHTFAPAIAAAGNARLAAVLSRDKGRAEALARTHPGAKAYDDLGAFAADPEVEAVWIASPNHLHAEQAIAALEAGKHVLCEKPMATSAADCERMGRAASAAGRVLSVGYHMRHHPDHAQVRADWIAGRLGKPACVRAQLYYAYPQPPPEWRRRRETSGGWAINDVGTHLIDLLRWLCGEAKEVRGHLSSPRFGLETDDHALVAIRFQSGALGIADGSTGAGAPAPRLELYGADGYCVLEGTLFGGGGTIASGWGNGPPKVRRARAMNLYQLQVESFGRAVRGEGELLATAADGLENVRIIERARGW